MYFFQDELHSDTDSYKFMFFAVECKKGKKGLIYENISLFCDGIQKKKCIYKIKAHIVLSFFFE